MIRETIQYQAMTAYMAVGIIEGFEEASSEEQVQAAWQFAHDNPSVAGMLAGSLNQFIPGLIGEGVIDA